MSAKRVALVLSIFVCIAGVATAQTVWVDNAGNPVIEPGPPGSWNEGGNWGTAAVFDGSIYHLWFTGHDQGGNWSGVGHATSPDGVAWTMDPANPVVSTGEDGEWDDAYVIAGAVINDETQLYMWYTGSDGIEEALGYATSPDGSVWTKYEGNPVMDTGTAGSWDDTWLGPATVVVDADTYRMWYWGYDGSVGRIGYAHSLDGIDWTKRTDPVFEPADYPGAWDRRHVFTPYVALEGSTHHMWYTGSDGTEDRIGYAYSIDGIEWTRHRDNPVVDSPGASHPVVILDGSTYLMWYAYDDGGWQVSYATSRCCPGVAGLTHMLTIPAAAVASGAQGAFFQTDVDVSNAGSQSAQYEFMWFPRGEDNSAPATSETFSLGAGMSVRYNNVLAEVFGLEPDSLGALAVLSTSPDLLFMSRTYNSPTGESAGTFGQAIPAIPPGDFIQHGERRRILFGSQNEAYRTNIGCVNATGSLSAVEVELFDADGTSLETMRLRLYPWSNDQINRIFSDYAPVNGCVDVWSVMPGAKFYCYGSVLDNITSDPTTILPQ